MEQQLEASLRVARSVLETDVWGVAASVARAAVELVAAQQGSVGLVDCESGDIFTAASLELPRPPRPARFAKGEGVAGWVAATGRAALIHDVRKDPRYLRLRYPAVRSFLAVPMQTNGELVGVLCCGAWETHAFGEAEVKAISVLGEHAAVSLKTALELQALRQQTSTAKDLLLDAVHELKAPLHSISGMLDLVLRAEMGPLGDGQRDFLLTARQECVRLNDGIAALLEMSAAQRRGRIATQMVPFGECLAPVLERLQPVAQLRQVTLHSHLPECLPTLEVDRAAIQQVLTNLVGNAIRVSPAHSAVVLRVEPLGEEIAVSVSDGGPGVPLDQQERIFERFSQAEPATRAPGEVGLGLALCRDIVERHGGRIWVESANGGGACLRFTLPTR